MNKLLVMAAKLSPSLASDTSALFVTITTYVKNVSCREFTLNIQCLRFASPNKHPKAFCVSMESRI
jgi:hypothetical protein